MTEGKYRILDAYYSSTWQFNLSDTKQLEAEAGSASCLSGQIVVQEWN